MPDPKKKLDLSAGNAILKSSQKIDLSAGDAILKKKESTQPTSQESVWGSNSQPKDAYTSLVIDKQIPQPASGSSSGSTPKGSSGLIGSANAFDPGLIKPTENYTPVNKSLQVANDAYDYALKNINPQKSLERYNDEVDQFQFIDGVKEGLKKSYNTFVGTPLNFINEQLGGDKDFKIGDYRPLQAEKEAARKLLIEEKQSELNVPKGQKAPEIKITEQEINKKAKEIFLKNDEQDQLHSLIDGYLPRGYDREGIWKELKLNQLRSNDILREKVASAEVFKSQISQFEEYSKKVDKKNPTPEQINKYNSLLDKAKKAADNLDHLSKNYDSLLKLANDDQEKLELFKYNYNDFEKSASLFYGGLKTIAGGATKLAGETLKQNRTGINPVLGQLLSDSASEVMQEGEDLTSPFYRYKATKLNSWSDLGSYATQLGSEQIPILGTIYLGGPAGTALVSMSSGGQKIKELEDEAKKPFGRIYSDGEKLAAGWLYAGAEFIPEQLGTARILKDLERTVSAASSASRKLFKDSLFKTTLNSIGKFSYNAGLEGTTELVTTEGQFVVDEELLGIVKTDFDKNEQRSESFFAGTGMGGSMSVVGGGLGFAVAQSKLYSDTKSIKEVQSLMNQIQKIKSEIDSNPLLTESETADLYKKMNSLNNQAFDVVASNANKGVNLSVREKSALLDINQKQKELKEKYNEVYNSNFSREIKNDKIKELKAEFDYQEQNRNGILNGSYNELTTISKEEKAKLKEQAANELTAEKIVANPELEGKEVVISDTEIEKRALENYRNSKEQTNEEVKSDENQTTNEVVLEAPAVEFTQETTPEVETTPKTYVEELSKIKESDPETYWSVSEVSEEDAAKGTIIDTTDGSALVKPDGDIAGVFKKLASKAKGVAQDLLNKAVAAGGIKLDNFDGYLTKQYEKAGFRVVSRTPFNEQYAPEGWNKEKHGTPDVVAMVYDPNNELDIEEKTFDDYDQAIAYRDGFIGQAKALTTEANTVQEVIDESEKSNDLPSLVQKAKTALSKILPGVKIVLYNTEDEYKAAINEGNDENSGGAFVQGKIHINPNRANGRTVAHEVFHAILLNMVKSDPAAQRVTAAMITAIEKVLPPDMKSKLQDFVENGYDAQRELWDEEKLAELVGYLAENFSSLSQPAKNIIKQWLDQLAKLVGLKEFTDKEVIDFMNTISGKIASGEEITEKDVKILKPKTTGNLINRFQANFTDPISKVEFSYDKNTEDFKKLEKEGFITRDKSINDFNGQTIFLHQPDAAFSGEISKNGESLVSGKGGVYYPVKFHNDGFFWASTASTANKMAKDLNAARKANGGKLLMALTTAPSDKLLSSTTAANGVMEIVISKAFDKNFSINKTQVKNSLVDAANTSSVINGKKVGLGMNIKKGSTIEEVKSEIAKKLNPDKSSFADRKAFVEKLLSNVANIVKADPKAVDQFGKFFSEGIKNEAFKGKTKTGKLSISAANLKQGISEMLTEPMLKEGVDRNKGGQVYAILELNGDVNAVDSNKHESYPKAIQSADPNNKVTLHILKDRVKWNEVFEDPTTNEIVSKERELNIFPTSGVSTTGLKLNTENISSRKQADTVKDRKQTSSEFNKELNNKEINLLRRSLRMKFKDSFVVEVLDDYVNSVKEDTPANNEATQYLLDNGVTLNRLANLMVDEGNFETKSRALGYFNTVGGLGESVLSRKQTNRPSVNKIYDQSEQAIKDRNKKRSIKDLGPYLRKSLLDRQAYVKRLLDRIDNKSAKKAYDLLVTKAGASALAAERFKQAEKEIYGKLNSEDTKTLDKIIYARRIVAVNESRAKLGMPAYTGIDGYSLEDAKQDLVDFKQELGDKKFNELSDRATTYFNVFKANLRKLYDSGRISKEVYDSLRNTEYSPIKTIKYIIGDNLSPDEIDTQAKSLGISRKDIMKLSDSNENEIILDSKWLLAMNIGSVEGRAFENRMLNEFNKAIESATADEKKAFEEFVLDNPVVGTKKDGGLKYKYDDIKVPVGYTKVSFFENGNKREIILKDIYAKQLLDVKNKDTRLETIGKYTGSQILRFFATGGNPLFIIGNTAVDFQNIAFWSDTYSKFKPLAAAQLMRDFTKNFIKKAVMNNKYNAIFNEYINHGGALDYLSNDGLKALESMNPVKSVTKQVQKGLLAYGRAMSFLGETSEVAFRLSVFEKVKEDSIKEFRKENGREPNFQEKEDILWKAAREARETMDFSQGGDVAKNIDAVFPYFNAALQGIRRPIDFAMKNRAGFAFSVLQYTAMAGSLTAASLAMLIKSIRDDEEDDEKANKKILEALNSVSEYEKANYHILFTGNKNKDGEYEYYRVKKLPVLSVISTIGDQLIYNDFFKNVGIDYKIDKEVIQEAVIKSNPLPMTIQELAGKNPAVSGAVSYWSNKDTFTGDKIFREPNNKKILPEAEGIFDDKVAQVYKDLAPKFGLSPIKTQVMIEKVITSENTNPTIPLIYSAYDGIFNKKDGLGNEVSDAMSNVGKAFGKKLVRYTDKNIIRYKKQDEMEYNESVIETDIWKKEQKVYNEIKKAYKEGDGLTQKELMGLVKENFEPIDQFKYAKKYNVYVHNMNIDKSVLDIIFEDVPEVQAMKLNQRYGANLEKEEMRELGQAMGSAGRKINTKAMYIYNKKYKERKPAN